MSVMDTVSEPAERHRKREKERQVRSVDIREGDHAMQGDNVCVLERESVQRTAEGKNKGRVRLLITQQHKSPSSEHFLKNISEWKSPSVHRDCGTSADLHMPLYFTSTIHDTHSNTYAYSVCCAQYCFGFPCM